MKIYNLKEQGHDIIERTIDLVLPPRCVVTGDFVDHQGMISPEAWQKLRFIGDPLCVCCGVPFEFEVGPESLCATCTQFPPLYHRARAALVYDDASRDMVLRFKHADQIHMVQAFLPWLQQAGRDLLAECDYLMPVPLHRWRLLKRRYNQAAVMARALAAKTGKSYASDILRRIKATPTQGHLNYEERKKNVRKAFIVNPGWQTAIKGKKIVLVDDVYTTGATVKECTKILLRAGVEEVSILSLTRTVRSDF